MTLGTISLVVLGALIGVILQNADHPLSFYWHLVLGPVRSDNLLMDPSRDNPLSFPDSANPVYYPGLHAHPQSPISMAILGNTPQLFHSVIYFLYNNLITCMVLAAKYNDYGNERKVLRVSEPRGAQRSTYYLSLPYRYIVPLLLSSAVLHWLVLQSSYYVRVVSYDQWGSAGAMISTCGFSVVAMIILLHLGGLMLRSCSAAISAACHPPGNDIDAALKPVKWVKSLASAKIR
ncbi:hypothetical protein BDV32DRAFT_153176 [Aspergillus pseudonomiae]|uniref:Uncharacterized protein n=1 Tax=Aspergillus pseudonomiae TaxID=1506151 RepID=A0A5N6HRU4_9EURO|nr:uncharacterized protein BDV37DRAFT_286843 [Aspergillus pseudonomiae]KAB8256554.1 hypothetical protein BDV32DRAFT_153176 [Aspergillus pseudonomiae]KAE8400212.1 hypothetical protein BDV37DRAFT_286843 [Aspergillus pseudonomiae]